MTGEETTFHLRRELYYYYYTGYWVYWFWIFILIFLVLLCVCARRSRLQDQPPVVIRAPAQQPVVVVQGYNPGQQQSPPVVMGVPVSTDGQKDAPVAQAVPARDVTQV